MLIAGIVFLTLCAISYWLFIHWLLIYTLAGVLLFFTVVPLIGVRSLAKAHLFLHAVLAGVVCGGLLGYFYTVAALCEAGWLIISVEDQYSLTRAEAQAAPDSLPYYEQALLDGVVLVFHKYPHGGEEPDVLH